MSPISSRNSVPPCAAWNSPRRSATAPVKEPFLCPKSSDSSSPSGIAPQFTATKGACARGLARWIARARSSLPVPLAPKMHTEASEAATRRACASRVLHRRGARDELRPPVLHVPKDRARQPHRLGHRVQQHLGLEGLGQKRKHPAPRRRHRLRESSRARSESPPAATANPGGSHRTAPSRPSPACADPSPPPAAATPTAPPAPPPRSPPPSPHTPTHSASSQSAAANPCRRRPAAPWNSHCSLLMPSSQTDMAILAACRYAASASVRAERRGSVTRK